MATLKEWQHRFSEDYIPPPERACEYADPIVRHIIKHQWDPTPDGWGTVPDVPLEKFSPFALALVNAMNARDRRLLYKRFKLTRATPLKERIVEPETLLVQCQSSRR